MNNCTLLVEFWHMNEWKVIPLCKPRIKTEKSLHWKSRALIIFANAVEDYLPHDSKAFLQFAIKQHKEVGICKKTLTLLSLPSSAFCRALNLDSALCISLYFVFCIDDLVLILKDCTCCTYNTVNGITVLLENMRKINPCFSSWKLVSCI